MRIGFTGTRNGMTDAQRESVALVMSVLVRHMPTGLALIAVDAHHGDCLGADEQFHKIARSMKLWMVGHPSTHNARAFCDFDDEREPKEPLTRNANIVRESSVMIAAPYEFEEQERGGTWATIRMARRAGKPLAIVMPDGSVQKERWL